MQGRGARATKRNNRSVGNLVDNIVYSGCAFDIASLIVLLVPGTCQASN